jgi:uncharacterized protein YjdB
MRMNPYYFTPVILLGVLALGPGCPSSSSNANSPTASKTGVVSVDVSPNVETISSGRTKNLTASATMGNGTKKDVTADAKWTSDNPKTVTVDNKGTLVGISTGITKVRVEYEGATASASVTVVP